MKLPHNGEMITGVDFERHLHHEDRKVKLPNLVQKARGDKTGLEPIFKNIQKICSNGFP